VLEVKFSAKMKRDYKRMEKRGRNMGKLDDVLFMLARRETLPPRYREHQLTGKLEGSWECHIEPDWLLIYQIMENELVLFATDTGTHSDLFKK